MRKSILCCILLAAGISAAANVSTSRKSEYVPNELIVKFRQPVADIIEKNVKTDTPTQSLNLSQNLNELNAKHKAKTIRPLCKGFKENDARINAILQKDLASLNPLEKRILRRLSRAPKGLKVPNLGGICKIEFELKDRQELLDALEDYKNSPDVEYAELNYIVSINLTPNDPLYPIQWSLNNTGQMYPESGNWNHPPGTPDCDINAPESWDIDTGSSDIIVAVVDTGVDYNHRDLHNNMWVNSGEIAGNGIDDDNNGYIDDVYGYDFINNDSDPIDDHGHGTHCSGIIAAATNNGLDIAGVCWNAKIMALKFLGSDGTGPTSNAVTAFYYAVNNGADVISNSWGGTDYSSSLQDAINYAYSRGVIVVVAAGNNNSSSPFYPACNNNVISVAATNSNDARAPFSNYGSWVSISAPGVDILSLRANGTSMGTVYDNYTTIASGTSMACPHVSGVIGLIMSNEPGASIQYIIAKLLNTTDDISGQNPAYKGLMSTGRVNAFKAAQPGFAGKVTLDGYSYSCDDTVGIELLDLDLVAAQNVQISMITNGGDSELVTLIKDVNQPWIFKGAIHTSAGTVTASDGVLEVSDGQVITAVYEDTNTGLGNPGTATATATVDCVCPVVSNVQASHITSSGAKITFTTNELALGRVRCGTTCGGPYPYFGQETASGTSHMVYLAVPASQTTYYFVVDANDVVGNETTNDNNGNCYSFTTTARPAGLNVPSQYPTIQAAIDAAANGNTVWVADGRYTGTGNKEIDFKGKAITVISESGADRCVIDCELSGRGFYFHSSEGYDSVLDGFTVTGARNFNQNTNGGAGIVCDYPNSNPTIQNCTITGNEALVGGGIGIFGSAPTIINCVITNNTATSDMGGGIDSWDYSSPQIIGCYIANNNAAYRGGGIFFFGGFPNICNCLIINNTAGSNGGGGICSSTNAIVAMDNCTLSGNSTTGYGDGICIGNNSTVTITNCILWENGTQEIGNDPSSCCQESIISYSDVSGGATGAGNINADPLFVTGPDGNYYLSQIAAGQASNSPCVNTGSDATTCLDVDSSTTRTDRKKDGGVVDMGYHYNSLGSADIDQNWYVDLRDYAILAANWLACSSSGSWLAGDINRDYCVDATDLGMLAEAWLNCYVTDANNAYPADNSVNIRSKVILNWSVGDGELYHDVYFGTDFNDVRDADTSSQVYQGQQDSNDWDSANYDSSGLALSTTYYWRIDEVGPACITKGSVWRFTTSDVADPNLVSWWKLDETSGTTAYDSARTYNGTLQNNPFWTTGQINGALDFSGDDGVYINGSDGTGSPLNIYNTDLTISAWVKIRGTGGAIVARAKAGDITYLLAANATVAYIDIYNRSHYSVSTPAILSLDTWYHIVGVFDRTAQTGRVYVDGIEQAEDAMTTIPAPNDATTKIGCRNSTTDMAFNGVIDDVRIYNQALSDAEIQQLYNDGLQ